MSLRRIVPAELAAGACGLALLIVLFVPWFDGADAWESFTAIDLLLAVVGAAAASLPLISAANAKPDAPIAATTLTAIGGGIATLLVLFRILDPPGVASRDVGVYLGLLAAAAIAGAAFRAMANEQT